MNHPALNRDDILAMARQIGLSLPSSYEDELVSAYGHVHAMLARLPRARARGDEPAHSFHPNSFLPTKE